MQKSNKYDVIVLGAGAAGLAAAITAAKRETSKKTKVLLLEKLPSVGAKLRATGGGRCNLTNTLSNDEFMGRFGRNGRFMSDALRAFDGHSLREFFASIGVQTHAPDGFRVFPVSHDSAHIVSALETEAGRVGVELVCNTKADRLIIDNGVVYGVEAGGVAYECDSVIIAVGGMGYPRLGAEGDGYALAESASHTIIPPSPAMLPLHTRETQFAVCRADTIPKAKIRIDLPKYKKLFAVGDLIFTKNGIRGPVVLDFAKEITPLLDDMGEVPLIANISKAKNIEEARVAVSSKNAKTHGGSVAEALSAVLPLSVATAISSFYGVDPNGRYSALGGSDRDMLLSRCVDTPLTVIGHDGFKNAMITKGGVSLKEICPKTMRSKLVNGLYFCGEVVDIDGPCGGYNLQWAFSSGYVAGLLQP